VPTPQLSEEFPYAGELNAILARALAKELPSRYATANELAQDLRAVLGVPLLALVRAACLGFCRVFEACDRVPRCHNCLQLMWRTAAWNRLCQSREEVIFGYRDSLTALKNGLWQEAAKLLIIHAAKYASDGGSLFLTPARYQLRFFECRLCSHHSARMTVDEMIEGKWEESPQSGEVYWGDVMAVPSLPQRLVQGAKAWFRFVPELVEDLRFHR
jgi:hypothetical protein